jgi:hypothetical protein
VGAPRGGAPLYQRYTSPQRLTAAPALTSDLGDTVRQLDEQILPTLERLLVRHSAVVDSLSGYGKGALPLPDADVLDRVRALQARQQTAITECVRQAANAEAALLALMSESGDGAALVEQARHSTSRLLEMHDVLIEVLDGSSEHLVQPSLPVA